MESILDENVPQIITTN